MLKKLSAKTNFILIGIVVGLFVGVSIRQALGDSTDTSGTVRADNVTVNMSANAENGLAVANGNLLVPNGNIGIGTTTPTAKLDIIGDISVSADGKAIGIKMWSGNLVVLDKVGIGVSSPAEKLDVQGNIRSAGYVKAESLCIGSTCIDENKLKAMMNGGTGTGGTVTSGTMTGTGTVSDPYMCPIAYLAGVQSPIDCKNDPAIKQGCCPTGTITSCRAAAGGSSLVGTGCSYNPDQPAKHLGVATDQGPAWFATYPTSGGNSKSPREVGSFCQYGYADWVYEQAPYTDKDGNVVSSAKIYSGPDCLDKIGSNSWCYRAEKWVQPCIN